MKNLLRTCIERIENAPLTLPSFLLAFGALMVARLTVEGALEWFQEESFAFFFFEFTHTLLFFLCSFLLILPIVRTFGGETIKKSANFLLFGFLIILTPPFIDRWIFGAGNYWSFYEFDGLLGLGKRFFTLFGDSPDIGITYGVRIEVVIATIIIGAYAYFKKNRLSKALLAALLTYSVLFVMGTFPSWITLLVLTFQKGLLAVRDTDVAALFLAPEQLLGRNLSDFRTVLAVKGSLVYALFVTALVGFRFYREYPSYFFSLVKNARVPQLTYHAGLLFLGMLLASHFAAGHIRFEFFHMVGIGVLLIATWSAWMASVITNDLYDTTIDTLTNPKRPLIEHTIPKDIYTVYGILFFLTSLLFAGLVSFSALLLLLAYQALAWLYSAPPLRLKQYPILATLCAASAGVLVLVAGFVSVTPDHSITTLPLPILLYLLIGYALVIPIKDFKDIEGDRKDSVMTLPVLLGAERAKHILSSALFLLFVMTPFILHMSSLFFPSLLFGSLAFFTVQRGTNNPSSFFSYKKLPGTILVIAELYALILIMIALN